MTLATTTTTTAGIPTNTTVVMRRQQKKAKIPVFFVGLAFGMMLMWVIMINIRLAAVSKQNLAAARRGLRLEGSSVEGWHPINVYYGEKKGLRADDQEWFSQVHQDEVIIDLLGMKGYFVDLASNDAKEYSNTLALEKHGWNGLCIEPNPTYWYGLSHRKCTVVGALVGAKHEAVRVKFRGVFGGIVGRMDNKLADRKKEPDSPVEDRFTAPLIGVFDQFNVPHSIDYLSLDVEGAEYLIMKDFPFEHYEIKVMTVERPKKELRRLLESKGFVFLKDLAWWGETLWAHQSTGFTPDHPKIKKIQTEERH